MIEDVNLSSLTTEQFRKIIEQLAKEKPPKIYKNGNSSNANIVIANIIKSSDHVNIFAENMDGTISNAENDFLAALDSFLSTPNKTLRIISEKSPIENTAISVCLNKYKHKVVKKIATEKMLDDIKSNAGEMVHFTTGDKDKFRLQYDVKNKSAYFSFNDTEITERLNAIFNKHWSECKPA